MTNIKCFLLIVLVFSIVSVAFVQTYKAGERHQAEKDFHRIAQAVETGRTIGWNACQEQF